MKTPRKNKGPLHTRPGQSRTGMASHGRVISGSRRCSDATIQQEKKGGQTKQGKALLHCKGQRAQATLRSVHKIDTGDSFTHQGHSLPHNNRGSRHIILRALFYSTQLYTSTRCPVNEWQGVCPPFEHGARGRRRTGVQRKKAK
eukprot:scaffold626_cov337-Pavlova_lutheri.AAC.47